MTAAWALPRFGADGQSPKRGSSNGRCLWFNAPFAGTCTGAEMATLP
jgi:hypothetical protein